MKPRHIVLLPGFLLFLSHISFSQAAPDGMPGIGDQGAYEKLYLHTDRDYYFLGDTIWFKAYYLNGQTQRFIQGLYVEPGAHAGICCTSLRLSSNWTRQSLSLQLRTPLQKS